MTTKICGYPDCGRPEAAIGYCQSHYKQKLNGEPMRTIRAKFSQTGLICLMPHCNEPARARNFCLKHKGLPERFPNYPREKIFDLFRGELKCGICGNTDSGMREFHIDHDHSCCSGCEKCVRGLLCKQCNHALGFFQDSIDTMESAIRYLKNHGS